MFFVYYNTSALNRAEADRGTERHTDLPGQGKGTGKSPA